MTWLIEHSTSHQLLWCIDSFQPRNPPLRQAPETVGCNAIDEIQKLNCNLADNIQIDYSLLTSELTLLKTPRSEFYLDSCQTGDVFMSFGETLIVDTLINLLNYKYLIISEKKTKAYKLLGYTIWTKEMYIIQLQKKPKDDHVASILEETIFSQYDSYNKIRLDKLISSLLEDLSLKKNFHTNPGKELILETIKKQKLGMIEFKISDSYRTRHVKITFKDEVVQKFTNRANTNENFTLNNTEIKFIKETVRKQLYSFQDLS